MSRASVAAAVRIAREAARLTWVDLAAAAGVSQVSVSHRETGYRVPALAHLLQVASVLPVPPDLLLRSS